jgi:DNA-binding transcriptional LysR family regulator
MSMARPNPIDRIERRISLHDMRVLMAVVQAGSMGKAAQRLATSQPAISRSIADLESALGVRLLDRSPQGIEPTSYARALIKRGLVVFDELQQGVKDVQFLADPTAGELRIGASIAVAGGFVSCIIDRLSRQHARMAFDVLATDSATAYRALIDRQVDLLVQHVIGPIPEHQLDTEVLLDDPHVVVAISSASPGRCHRPTRRMGPWSPRRFAPAVLMFQRQS